MNLKGTLILSITSLLERLSYYGVRSILVLYLIDPNTLKLNQTQTLEYYGYWSSALIFAYIPFSYITDKFLGQKRSIFIGGLLSLAGYSLFIIQNNYTLVIGLILVLFGTSFVKPSTTILIGRQFKKEDKNRTLAYMVFFLGINIGAFIGILGIGYIGEAFGWKYGFLIAVVSTMIYLIGLYLLRSHITEIETNIISSSKNRITFKKSVFPLSALILINMFFWKSHEIEIAEFIIFLSNSIDQTFIDYNFSSSIIENLTTIWAIPLTIFVFAYWYFKGVTNVFKTIGISLCLLIIAIFSTIIISGLEVNNLLEISMIPLGLFAFAEVLISPILISFVTRISDVKYSNTIYSTFIFLTNLLGITFVYIVQIDFQSFWILVILSLIVISLFLFENRFRKFTYEME